jgi:hypothetical protein
MEAEEINELLSQCDKLRELVRAIAAAMDHAEKRLQRIERQGRIWLFREACANRRDANDD